MNMFYPTLFYLNNNIIYKGWSLFDHFISFGEIVFNTGMTGYQEVITDPSYSGQIVSFTYPELGNTGLNNLDCESQKIHVKGIVAKNICSCTTNWRSQISLKDYIIIKRIPHIFGIDTRSLVKSLRSEGVMNGFIVSKSYFSKSLALLLYQNLDLVKRATTLECYSLFYSNYQRLVFNYLDKSKQLLNSYKHVSIHNITIVVLDFGVKLNILNNLLCRQCNVHVLPATSTYEEIKSYSPDGILLSNGPGNPSYVTYSVNTVKKLIEFSNIPIFGICMGHQILCLALGAQTFKLKFGHRGLNHPSGIYKLSEITSQNHGFAVSPHSFSDLINSINVSHINLNDSTVAGIFINDKPIFSVQYHPEASPGPHDSDYLFDFFIKLIIFVKKRGKN